MKYAKHTGVGYGEYWRGIIFRETYKQLEDLIAKSKRWFRRAFPEANYNKGSFTWSFPEGEELLLRHMADPDDYWNYHGHEFPFVGFEELTNWATLECYHTMKACNRSSWPGAPGVPPMPRFYGGTCNPFGRGHNAVKKYFISPAPDGTPITNAEGEQRVAIWGSVYENTALLTADPAYLKKLRAIPDPNRRKAWLEGSWDITSGGMFDDIWDRDIHVLPNFDVPRGWRLDHNFDWGSTKPSATLWIAESNGEEARMPDGTLRYFYPGTLIVCAEFYTCMPGEENVGMQMLSTEIATNIKRVEKEMGWATRVRPGVADAAIYDAGDGESIGTKMEGKGVRFIPSVKGPGSRINGWERVRELLAAALKRPMEAPGLFFMQRCTHSLRVFPTTPRDEDKPDDVDTEYEDHIPDVVRYRATTPIHTITVEGIR
jgi:hypothetical protein